MGVEGISEPGDPRLADYRGVSEPALLHSAGLFVAEGRQVVRTLLTASPYAVRSVLLTETAYAALRDIVEPRLPGLVVFLVPQQIIEQVTGFNISRGCLAIGQRPAPVALEAWLERAPAPRVLVAAEGVANPDNLGGLFRNAHAFGADALVLGPACADPLYRKCIRVSMGAALRVPWVEGIPWPDCLRRLASDGFAVVALTTDRGAVTIEAVARERFDRVVIVAGSEGEGLSDSAREAATIAVRIPMAPGVDSLNVATATGIALHRLSSFARPS